MQNGSCTLTVTSKGVQFWLGLSKFVFTLDKEGGPFPTLFTHNKRRQGKICKAYQKYFLDQMPHAGCVPASKCR